MLCWSFSSTVQAALIINVVESAGNVLAEFSGTADTTGLEPPSGGLVGSIISGSGENGLMRGMITFGRTGGALSSVSSHLIYAPFYFGTGEYTAATTASGDAGGLRVTIHGDSLLLPSGYVSGTPVNSRSVWREQSFESLGLVPGEYHVTWPTDTLSLYIGVFPTTTHSIGGTISGLTGSVTLQVNGGDDLTLSSNGAFQFSSLLEDTADYEVTIAEQPVGQVCTVDNGRGIISAASANNIVVVCKVSYTVSGTISGLTGTVKLRLNSGSGFPVSNNGPFGPFPNEVADNDTYRVTVNSQPPNQTCTVINGTGTISGSDVTDVSVECTDNQYLYSVSGTMTGLEGNVVLQLNGESDLEVTSNGLFGPFSSFVPTDSPYEVTVSTQPAEQVCTVVNGSGVIWNFDITDVIVKCGEGIYKDGFEGN